MMIFLTFEGRVLISLKDLDLALKAAVKQFDQNYSKPKRDQKSARGKRKPHKKHGRSSSKLSVALSRRPGETPLQKHFRL